MRHVFVLLALVALVAGAWLVVGVDHGGPIERDGQGGGAEETARLEPDAAEPRGVTHPTLVGRPAPPLPLAADHGGIYGTVRSATTGEPVAGVPVVALHQFWGPTVEERGRTVSGTDGRYAIRDLPFQIVRMFVFGLGNGWIPERAVDPNVSTTEERAWRVGLRCGAWIEHDVFVVEGAGLEGVILLPTGAPAVGAHVWIQSYWEDARPSHAEFPWAVVPTVTTDAAGRFVLDGLPPVKGLALEAACTGYRCARREGIDLVCGEATRVELAFDDFRNATVTVLDAESEQGIHGVLVRILGTDSTDRTDGMGLAEFDAAPATAVGLEVITPGYVPFRSAGDASSDALERDDEGRWCAEVRLKPLAHIRGRVVFPDGVETYNVSIIAEGLAVPGHEEFGRGTVMGEDGRFSIVVPTPGRYVVSLRASAVSGRFEAPAVEAEAGEHDVVLQAVAVRVYEIGLSDPGPSWGIRLLDPDGEPLARARFRRVKKRHLRCSMGVADGVEFEDGVVSFEAPRGDYRVWLDVLSPRTASGERLGAARLGPFDSSGGETTVRLAPGRSVAGRIIDTEGRPVPGADVHVRPAQPDDVHDESAWGGCLTTAVTDARGRFVLDDLAGDLMEIGVWAWPEYLVPDVIQARLGTSDALIRLEPTVSARVRILRPDGEPAQGAEICVHGLGGELTEDMNADVWRLQRWSVGEDGSAVIGGLDPDASYRLWIHAPSSLPGAEESRFVEPWVPHDTEFRLRRGGFVSGVVRGLDGRVEGNVCVCLRDAEGETHTTRSSWEGEFEFEELPAGAVSLTAAFGPQRSSWEGLKTVDAEVGDDDVVVGVESRRDLRVTFPVGDPGRSLHRYVRLTRLAGGAAGEWSDREYGSKGAFLFRGLEPGARYRLWAGPTETGRYALADVERGLEEVVLRSLTGGVIHGRALLPPSVQRVRAGIDERGIYIVAESYADGTFELRGVPPGRWTLRVLCAVGKETREACVEAEAGDEVEVDLRAP